MEPRGFAFAFDITYDSFALNVNHSSKSPFTCNPYSKTSPLSKSSSLSLGSNKRIVVLNHAEVKQFRHERVKKWLVKVKNVVYDGIEHKSFCLFKKGRSNTIACHSPSSTLPLLF